MASKTKTTKVGKEKKTKHVPTMAEVKVKDVDLQYKHTGTRVRASKVSSLIDCGCHHLLTTVPKEELKVLQEGKKPITELLNIPRGISVAKVLTYGYKLYHQNVEKLSRFIDYKKELQTREEHEKKRLTDNGQEVKNGEEKMILPSWFTKKMTSYKNKDPSERAFEIKHTGEFLDLVNACEDQQKIPKLNESKGNHSGGALNKKVVIEHAISRAMMKYLIQYHQWKKTTAARAEWDKLSEDEQKALRKKGKKAPSEKANPGKFVNDPFELITDPYEQAHFILDHVKLIRNEDVSYIVCSSMNVILTDIIKAALENCHKSGLATLGVNHVLDHFSTNCRYSSMITNTKCMKYAVHMHKTDDSTNPGSYLENCYGISLVNYIAAPTGEEPRKLKPREVKEEKTTPEVVEDTDSEVEDDAYGSISDQIARRPNRTTNGSLYRSPRDFKTGIRDLISCVKTDIIKKKKAAYSHDASQEHIDSALKYEKMQIGSGCVRLLNETMIEFTLKMCEMLLHGLYASGGRAISPTLAVQCLQNMCTSVDVVPDQFMLDVLKTMALLTEFRRNPPPKPVKPKKTKKPATKKENKNADTDDNSVSTDKTSKKTKKVEDTSSDED
jgi:hypothetical protein